MVVLAGSCADVHTLEADLPGYVEEMVLVQDDSPCTPRASNRLAVRTAPAGSAAPGLVPHAGLLAARGEYIVLLEANSMSPNEIPHYLHYLEIGYDFVKGSRFMAGGESASYSAVHRAGRRALLSAARLLYGQQLTDLWYGFCAFRRSFLDLLDLENGKAEMGPEIVTHALHNGLRIAEVPSVERPHRRSTPFLRTVQDGSRILRTLIDERPRNVVWRHL